MVARASGRGVSVGVGKEVEASAEWLGPRALWATPHSEVPVFLAMRTGDSEAGQASPCPSCWNPRPAVLGHSPRNRDSRARDPTAAFFLYRPHLRSWRCLPKPPQKTAPCHMTYIRGKARRADSEGALTGPISDLGLYANKLQQPPLLKYLFIKNHGSDTQLWS